MSDYLSSLVTRSLKPNTGVRPRIPTLFETAGEPVWLQPAPDFEDRGEVQTAAPITPPASDPLRRLPREPVPVPGISGVKEPVLAGPMPRLEPPEPAMAKAREPAPAPSAAAAKPLSRSTSSDDQAPPGPAPARAADLPGEPAADAEPAASRVQSSEAVIDPPRRPAPAVQMVPLVVREWVPQPVLVKAVPPPLPPREMPVPEPARIRIPRDQPAGTAPRDTQGNIGTGDGLPAPQPSTVPAHQRSGDAAPPRISIRPVMPMHPPSYLPDKAWGRPPAQGLAAARETTPVPDIHVTIGSLEVRTSAPAAAPRAKTKKEPALSLESYLQRRTEGGRR